MLCSEKKKMPWEKDREKGRERKKEMEEGEGEGGPKVRFFFKSALPAIIYARFGAVHG